MDRRLARRDAVEAVAHDGLGGEFLGGDALGDVGSGELVEVGMIHPPSCPVVAGIHVMVDLASGRAAFAAMTSVQAQFAFARPAAVPAILPNTEPEQSPEPPG